MNTDTPRTDEAWAAWPYAGSGMSVHVGRQLERELNAARAEIAEWRILNGWGGTPEIINDFIKGQQTRIHYAQNLDEELTAVTEQRDRLEEALESIVGESAYEGLPELKQLAIEEALQSLTLKDNE